MGNIKDIYRSSSSELYKSRCKSLSELYVINYSEIYKVANIN